MARLLGPDPSTRSAVRYTAAMQVEVLAGKTLTVYVDEACTVLASIAAYQPASPGSPGAVIAGSAIKVADPGSQVPLFWFPDGVDTVWAQTRDGYKLRLVADVDARLDGAAAGQSSFAGAGVRATLKRGIASTCIQIVGDSTGTDTDEWFGVMGRRLGQDYPGYTVLWRQWNTTSQEYDLPSVLQAGTANGGGDRHVTLASGALAFTSGAAATGDLELRARVMPAAGWAPGGAAALRTIVSRYNASGSNRAWYLALNEAGNLVFVWSSAGTADTGTVVSTAAVPFSNGTPGWVRATFDVDNGAAGSTATFYTSSDGITWNQLGSPVVTAGVTSIASAATNFQIGAINTTAAQFFDGRIYWVDVRSALTGGPSLVPPLPDDWDQTTTATSVSFGGAPVIVLLCGSASGQNITYFNDPTRRSKLLPPHGQQVVFLSTGHNEGNATGVSWRSTYSTWLNDVKTRVPLVPLVAVAQNPTQIGAQISSQRGVDQRTNRGPQVMSVAASQAGVYGLDVWPQFPAASLGTLLSDGLHPGVGAGSGSELWGLFAYQRIFS